MERDQAHAAGAREERARIVAWLRDDMRNFDGSKLMSVDDAGDIIADAIEAGEHEEKANG